MRQRGVSISSLVSLLDIMPTVIELAQYEEHAPTPALSTHDLDLDGASLVGFLQEGEAANHTHPNHVVSQHHGENMVMSWYMIRKADLKYVVWGTGKEHDPQLFNLTADPDEMHNLARIGSFQDQIDELDALLRKTVDYPAVSLAVATYNIEMARWWMRDEPDWLHILNGTASSKHHTGVQTCLSAQPQCKGGSDWGEIWQVNNSKYLQAWEQWVSGSPKIVPCPDTLTFDWNARTGVATPAMSNVTKKLPTNTREG